MLFVIALLELRQKGAQRRLGIADNAVIDFGAATELFAADVDLHNGRVFRKKLLVGKVGSDHQERVAIHHRAITGGKSEQTGHADIERIIIFDEFFPAQRVYDRRVQFSGDGDEFRMRAGTTGAGQDGYLFRIVENFRDLYDLIVGGRNARLRRRKC